MTSNILIAKLEEVKNQSTGLKNLIASDILSDCVDDHDLKERVGIILRNGVIDLSVDRSEVQKFIEGHQSEIDSILEREKANISMTGDNDSDCIVIFDFVYEYWTKVISKEAGVLS
ncbi:hypothetical protein [Acanthopleuribacter pedis]|uniref:Uncharacterized protein n=1 Tax=Acanthopleuribacter pedis TaxID=442870 RepID=A0A8J7QGP8_9BACT|nr:hypothetical protein [Acanthopleuribacter pedis]MBO1321990.1 hypothetical protein [Acanthopleuribacter pedis]